MDNQIDISEDRTWAMLCHLGALAFLMMPFGPIVVPALIWFARRDEDPLVKIHGRASLNFQLTLTLLSFVWILLFVGGVAGLFVKGFSFTHNNDQVGDVARVYSGVLAQSFGAFVFPLALVLIGVALLGLTALLNLLLITINSVRAYDGREPYYRPAIPFFKARD